MIALLITLTAIALIAGLGELQSRTRIRSLVLRLPVLGVGFSWLPFLILVPSGAPGEILAHEREHERQRQRDGWLRWTWRYVTQARWTARYEAAAYAHQGAAWVEGGTSVEQAVDTIMRPLYERDLYWWWPWLSRPAEGWVRQLVEHEIRRMVRR